jgi:hypothetical protein
LAKQAAGDDAGEQGTGEHGPGEHAGEHMGHGGLSAWAGLGVHVAGLPGVLLWCCQSCEARAKED